MRALIIAILLLLPIAASATLTTTGTGGNQGPIPYLVTDDGTAYITDDASANYLTPY